MNLAEQMKESIERYANEVAECSPIAKLVLNGRLSSRAMALYLESLRYLFENTQRNLALAAARCDTLGRPALAEYLSRKAKEEVGHDRWAVSDLARLPAAATSGIQPARAVIALVELQVELIESDPLCFVAYLQWAEYFSVYVGDRWLDALAMSGYQRTQVTAIHNHLETDRHHAAAGFRELDALARDFPQPERLIDAVERAGRVFDWLLDEICVEAQRAA
jgi:hypothetical protein